MTANSVTHPGTLLLGSSTSECHESKPVTKQSKTMVQSLRYSMPSVWCRMFS
jgi:hypothetical protein